MNIIEALAVMLYLQNAVRSAHEERVYSEAWGVVLREAEKAIRARADLLADR